MIVPASEITFHIIYTRDTVRALLPFVDTLLHWSTCKFCLVANGCDAQEVALLRDRCQGEPRLCWQSLPYPSRAIHGTALNYLFAHTDGDTFCFMDSDILATGDFMADLLPYLEGAAGVFSAWPIELNASKCVLLDNCPVVTSGHRITPQGTHLGATYLAIYDRQVLADGMAHAPAGFNRSFWSELPAKNQAALSSVDRRRLRYDTGRVLNLHLIHLGYRLYAEDTDKLCHLGSYSVRHVGKAQPRNRLRALLGRFLRGMERRLLPFSRRSRIEAERIAFRQMEAERHQRLLNQPRPRQLVQAYLVQLENNLQVGLPLPALPHLGDSELDARLARATRLLVEVRQSANVHG